MKNKTLLPMLLMIGIFCSCNDRNNEEPKKAIKIVVLADVHYMDPSLLKNGAENGEAFQNYLNADPKLVQYSDAIFRQTISKVKAENPDIVLIAGDLTKDGELVSHQSVASLLKEFGSSTKVIVVPGNHDIQNPEARAYDGDDASLTPSISPAEFSSIYSNFGYASAIARDPNSLSYVSQPYKDLWILVIDGNKYYENIANIAVVSGVIKPQTMQWLKDQLALAKEKNIRVLGLMHHNMIEHYAGQDQLDPGYVTDNWEANADALSEAGLDVIFTGHYHANDISSREHNGNKLYDVETASLVDPPLPYRIVSLKNRILEIDTKFITTIPTALPEKLDLTTYSTIFLSAHLDGIFSYLLTQPPFVLSEKDAADHASLFRNAYMAHFAGDERITGPEQTLDNALALLSPMCGVALSTLWTDLNPQDTKIQINLRAK